MYNLHCMKISLIAAVLCLSIVSGSILYNSNPVGSGALIKSSTSTPVASQTIGYLTPQVIPVKPVEPAPIIENVDVQPTYLSETDIFMKYGMLDHTHVWSMIQRIRDIYPEHFTADKYEASVAYIASLFDCSNTDCNASYVIGPIEANFHW